jgi:FkbM family methyltransferase
MGGYGFGVSLVHRIQRRLASYGIVTHRRRNLRYGSDPMLDLERLLPSVTTVLDVGANEGQMALSFAEAFPDARVFAFEPVPATFSNLVERTADMPQIECFDVALGPCEDDVTIQLADRSGQNSLLNAVPEPGPDTVTLRVTTGDAWASEHGVEHVDVLKIDTEGYDLNVLSGFEALLAEGRVEAALVECEFDRVRPEPHTNFFELYEHLTTRGMGFTTLYTDSVNRHRFAWGNALFTRS